MHINKLNLEQWRHTPMRMRWEAPRTRHMEATRVNQLERPQELSSHRNRRPVLLLQEATSPCKYRHLIRLTPPLMRNRLPNGLRNNKLT